MRGVERAELVFEGVEQAGPSFEGRVFLNNPEADDGTEPTAENGYAGSFYVYGYGEPTPPDVAEARERGETGVIAPIEKRLDADMSAIGDDAGELTVTVVAVPSEPGGSVPETPLEKVELVLDRAR